MNNITARTCSVKVWVRSKAQVREAAWSQWERQMLRISASWRSSHGVLYKSMEVMSNREAFQSITGRKQFDQDTSKFSV